MIFQFHLVTKYKIKLIKILYRNLLQLVSHKLQKINIIQFLIFKTKIDSGESSGVPIEIIHSNLTQGLPILLAVKPSENNFTWSKSFNIINPGDAVYRVSTNNSIKIKNFLIEINLIEINFL